MSNALEVGYVDVIYSDYTNKVPKEITIQLTDTIAVEYKLNKDTNNVDMTIKNTLIDDIEYGGVIKKEELVKMMKAEKDMFRQLT